MRVALGQPITKRVELLGFENNYDGLFGSLRTTRFQVSYQALYLSVLYSPAMTNEICLGPGTTLGIKLTPHSYLLGPLGSVCKNGWHTRVGVPRIVKRLYCAGLPSLKPPPRPCHLTCALSSARIRPINSVGHPTKDGCVLSSHRAGLGHA